MKGPLFHFKTDAESRVGRGCHLYASHFVPEVVRILWAAGRSAPKNCSIVRCTEGYRSVGNDRDLHEECRAFDFTGESRAGWRLTHAELVGMAEVMRELLGPSYDVICHGEESNFHIHVEYDP